MKKKILLVSRKGFAKDLIREGLIEEGYRVILAENSEELIDKYRSETPDLIFVNMIFSYINSLDIISIMQELGISAQLLIWSACDLSSRSLLQAFGADIIKTSNFINVKTKIKELLSVRLNGSKERNIAI